MENYKLILTENQVRILKGEAILNTLFSLLDEPNFHSYNIPAINTLIKKIGNLK